MKNHLLSSVVMIVAASTILFAAQKVKCQSDISDEEYAVYSAVINNMFASGKVTFDTQAKVKLLVIKDHTINDRTDTYLKNQNWKYFKERLPSVSQETLDDFASKNEKDYLLKDAFITELNRTFITERI